MRVVIIGIVVVGSAVPMGIVVLGISISAGAGSGFDDEVVISGGGVIEGMGSGVGVGAIVVGIADSVLWASFQVLAQELRNLASLSV